MPNITSINNNIMDFTGERFVPEVKGPIELEHLHRYILACELVQGKTVLDIASGEGYGSAMLAEKADKVIGVDISAEAVAFAQEKYAHDKLKFLEGSCADIPLPDCSVDLVISFETIEHHDQHEQMMLEIKRILRPGGQLLISSPDKYHYSIKNNYKNPYHLKELYVEEFKELLSKHFANTAYFGQKIVYGSLILPESLTSSVKSYWQDGKKIVATSGLAKAIYWLALATDADLPHLESGLFERPIDESEAVQTWSQLTAKRDAQITSLSEESTQRAEWALALESELKQRDQQLAKLNDEFNQRTEWALALEKELKQRDQQLAKLNDELNQRTEWALALEQQLKQITTSNS